jgi:FkbM family methyltransferase
MSNRAEGDVDQIVLDRFFRRVTGTFVEVGAARPDYLSTSALFRKEGWNVIAIEPNPAYAELHRRLGHEVLPYACGDHDEDDVEFSVVDSHGTAYEGGGVTYESFSSLAIKENYASLKPNLDVKKIRVNLRRLDTILAEHAPSTKQIDIVSVDVEGWELEVLKGLSFDRFRPKVLIVENLFSENSYREFMRDRGYALWRTSKPNEVFVRPDLLTGSERRIAGWRARLASVRQRWKPGAPSSGARG